MIRPLQGHHQGGAYKGVQVQQILLKDGRGKLDTIQSVY
jgi:hypothetical protein